VCLQAANEFVESATTTHAVTTVKHTHTCVHVHISETYKSVCGTRERVLQQDLALCGRVFLTLEVQEYVLLKHKKLPRVSAAHY
jgi:hypothetical protein